MQNWGGDLSLRVGREGLWQTFHTRLLPQGGPPGQAPGIYVSKLISPTMDVGEVLERINLRFATVSASTNTNLTMLTVPENERWWLHVAEVSKVSPGDYDVVLRATQSTRDGGNSIGLADPLTGTNLSARSIFGHAIPLGPGWSLTHVISNHVATGNTTLRVLVTRKEWAYYDAT